MTKEQLYALQFVALICVIASYFLGMNMGKIQANKRFDDGMLWIKDQDLNRCYGARTDMFEGFYYADCINRSLDDFIKDFKMEGK